MPMFHVYVSISYTLSLSEPEPQYYPTHASPNWESSKTVFTSRADMNRLGWKRDRNEDQEDASNNGNN